MTTVRYEWDTSDADRELRRLQDGFDSRDHTNFGAVLFREFVYTQEDVHVLTGSLMESGVVDVTTSESEKWEGHISYGGSSYGPNDPVKYALHEQQRHPGVPVARPKSPRLHTDNHDFMHRTSDVDRYLMDSLMAFFDRGHSTAVDL